MIVPVLSRLREFAPLRDYEYVGLGSVYFSDFSLFHKRLGIRSMTSLEEDVANRERFEFNVPFACVEMRFGVSGDILPVLDWGRHAIVWLDYDGKLDGSVLGDVEFVCMAAAPGSVILVTVNAHPDDLESEHPAEARLRALAARLPPEVLPAGLEGRDLSGWGTAAVTRQVLENRILSTLRNRSAGSPPQERWSFRPLFSFEYRDGARMTTFGGLLHEEWQQNLVAKCGFEEFSYARTRDEPYRIEVPNLTFREMRHLDAQLPEGAPRGAPGVPERDVTRYGEVYRYFPAFVDAEF